MSWQKVKHAVAIILIWLIALSIVYLVYAKAKIFFHP